MKKGILVLAGVALAASAFSQFTPGNLVVVGYGDGAAALTANASQVTLFEYTTLGASVGTPILMPTAISGANKRMVGVGNSTSEGFLARSDDGRYVCLAGYDCDLGTLIPHQTDATTINRVVARVGASGTIDTSTAFVAFRAEAPPGSSNIRSVCTVDGTSFWAGGTSFSGFSAGIQHMDLGGANLVQVMDTPNNTRVAKIYAGQLYVSSASGAFIGINQVGTGLSTTSGTLATKIMDCSVLGTSPSPYDFYFSDANTCYVCDDRTVVNGGGIQKFVFGGVGWGYQYTMNTGLPGGCRGITGVNNGGTVTLYATTANGGAAGGNSLVTVTDAGAGSVFSILATAPANVSFHGIAFVPVSPVTTIHADSVTLTTGIQLSGTSANVNASDNTGWQVRPGAVFSNAFDPVVIEATGTALGASPSSLTATVEDQATSLSVARKMWAWDYTLGTPAYVQIGPTANFLAAGTDETKTITLNPALNIKAGTFEMKTKVSYRTTAAVFSYPWKVTVDEIKWTYTS